MQTDKRLLADAGSLLLCYIRLMNKCLAVHGDGVFGGEMFARLEVVDPRT